MGLAGYDRYLWIVVACEGRPDHLPIAYTDGTEIGRETRECPSCEVLKFKTVEVKEVDEYEWHGTGGHKDG